MRRLVAARHGESETGAAGLLNGDPTVGSRLTTRGRAQARGLGDSVGPVDVTAHTDFARTLETAEVAWPAAPRLCLPELNEISYGRFEGTMWRDGYGEWVAAAGPADPSPGGGESRAGAVRRYVAGYRILLARPEETVALVGHGIHLAYVLLALQGLPPGPVLPGVPPAVALVVDRDRLSEAVDVMDAWAREPVWG